MERWLPVVGYPAYEVSDHGRVRSVDRVVHRTRNGKPVLQPRRGVVLKPGRSKEGYLLVVLHGGSGGKSRKVHQLVLEAFVGPRPAGMQCLHADGDGGNDALANLRWGTPKENTADSIRHGTHTRMPGEAHHQAKLTDGRVRLIRAALDHGVPGAEIARQLSVSSSTVSLINRGKTWTHLPR